MSELDLRALQDAHTDMRMLVSGAGSPVSTSDFKRTQELLRGQKEAGGVCLSNSAVWGVVGAPTQ